MNREEAEKRAAEWGEDCRALADLLLDVQRETLEAAAQVTCALCGEEDWLAAERLSPNLWMHAQRGRTGVFESCAASKFRALIPQEKP